MRQDFYQILLIASGVIVTGLLGIFAYREMYPEYKIYQKDYIALEEFRSSYTHQPPPDFHTGVKQVVLEKEDLGPPTIDRCTSCHVALQIPYFSPTKIARDINGNIIRDADAKPVQVPNEDYIWEKLDQKIAELRDEKVNEQLTQEGRSSEIKQRLKQATEYEALKVAYVGEHTYDVTKVLSMHPLMGKETRPFEYHPIEEYGCTSCHNGNGRGLVTDKAHGPVFDHEYEAEDTGHTPQFLELDQDNDPSFAHVFNAKPGHSLLFQTQPLFVGSLIQAKCMQCHQTSQMQLENVSLSTSQIAEKRKNKIKTLQDSLNSDEQTVSDLLDLRQKLLKEGYAKTLTYLKQKKQDYTLPNKALEQAASQEKYLTNLSTPNQDEEKSVELALQDVNNQLLFFLGSSQLIDQLQQSYSKNGKEALNLFLKEKSGDPEAKGALFKKAVTLNFEQEMARHAEDTENSFQMAASDQKAIHALQTDVDELTHDFQRGKELYLSQACYACHRISGLTRGGVGPELTRIGEHYPWYIKQSIVWPQADLKSSTMPNMRLDHEEVEDLMTFLLAQRGGSRAIAPSAYQASLQSWEAGRKLPWEKPIPPAQMYDLRYSMTVFVTEGCASCHRMMGYDSNVGFKVEKEHPSFDALYEQQQWFKTLFPETIRLTQYDEPLPGSIIVDHIEKNAKEIDNRIVSDVRTDAIIEEIEKNHPQSIEALYSNFRYASRAKDHYYDSLVKQEKDPEKQRQILAQHAAWKDRVHRVLMTYIQVYGLGRLIGPRPNWSGVYRTDQWLMEHFHNPSAHVPRSIMPVMPFDDTKFYALTHLLDVLGVRNRNTIRAIWENRGFNPEEAFQIHCTQCHGQSMGGNGAVSEWIYPIPKNLHNPDFLRNLTRERAVYSIKHGVKGTPMPPLGEVAQDKPDDIQKELGNQSVLSEAEIERLVDWMFSSLSGGEVIKEHSDVLKWQYRPEDVLDELKREGGKLESMPPEKIEQLRKEEVLPERELPQENVPPPAEDESVTSFLPTGKGLYAAIRPEIYPRTSPRNVKYDYQVKDVFDLAKGPNDDPDQDKYFIKKKYYTPYNIQEGQKFFLLNCAVCHGNEGDGSGSRSLAMQEGKPRMLTNLDWIQSRDDLRLLRSIKYGVPGTSMTPWGDLTSSLQRIQLVIFIRTLTQESNKRKSLDDALYHSFEQPQLMIEDARIEQSQLLQSDQQKKKELQDRIDELEHQVKEGKVASQEALELYQNKLVLEQEMKKLEIKRNLYLELKSEVKREREIYFNLGMNLINKNVPEDALNTYFNIIKLNQNRYQIENGHLAITNGSEQIKQMRELQQELVRSLEKKVLDLKNRQKVIEEERDPNTKIETLKDIEADINAYEKLQAKTITDLEEALRSMKKQKELVNQL